MATKTKGNANEEKVVIATEVLNVLHDGVKPLPTYVMERIIKSIATKESTL